MPNTRHNKNIKDPQKKYRHVKIRERLDYDFHTLVIDRVISPFCEGYIFTKFRIFRENKTLAKIIEFTVHCDNDEFFSIA